MDIGTDRSTTYSGIGTDTDIGLVIGTGTKTSSTNPIPAWA